MSYSDAEDRDLIYKEGLIDIWKEKVKNLLLKFFV